MVLQISRLAPGSRRQQFSRLVEMTSVPLSEIGIASHTATMRSAMSRIS
jgi:hypothetical protein